MGAYAVSDWRIDMYTFFALAIWKLYSTECSNEAPYSHTPLWLSTSKPRPLYKLICVSSGRSSSWSATQPQVF